MSRERKSSYGSSGFCLILDKEEVDSFPLDNDCQAVVEQAYQPVFELGPHIQFSKV